MKNLGGYFLIINPKGGKKKFWGVFRFFRKLKQKFIKAKKYFPPIFHQKETPGNFSIGGFFFWKNPTFKVGKTTLSPETFDGGPPPQNFMKKKETVSLLGGKSFYKKKEFSFFFRPPWIGKKSKEGFFVLLGEEVKRIIKTKFLGVTKENVLKFPNPKILFPGKKKKNKFGPPPPPPPLKKMAPFF